MVEAKRRAFLFIIIAFVLAVIASGVIINKLNAMENSTQETMKVATAAKDIKSYETLKTSDIKWVNLPTSDQVQGVIENPAELRQAIAVVDIQKGDLMTTNVVRDKTNIPTDQRVVMPNITPNVITDQNLAEGDRVDVFAVIETDKKVESKLIFKGLEVVQVEQNPESERDSKAPKNIVKVATTVQQAQQLIYYQNIAKQIRVLRHPNNSDQ